MKTLQEHKKALRLYLTITKIIVIAQGAILLSVCLMNSVFIFPVFLSNIISIASYFVVLYCNQSINNQ